MKNMYFQNLEKLIELIFHEIITFLSEEKNNFSFVS